MLLLLGVGVLLRRSLLLLRRGVVLLSKLHVSELLGEFAVSSVHTGGSDIWISLNNFQRALQDIDGGAELLSALGHTWGLSQHASDSIVAVDSVPEVLLELILGLLHEEVSNLLGDCVTNTPQYNSEIIVDSGSNFLDERCLSANYGLNRHSDRLTLLIILLLWGLLSLVFFKVNIIGEDVVLLSFDNSANNL